MPISAATVTRMIDANQQLSAADLRLLVETAPIGMSVKDMDGRFELVNDAYCALFGCTREELLGTAGTRRIVPDQRRHGPTRYSECPGAREAEHVEWEVPTRTGQTRTLVETGVTIAGTDGLTRRVSFVMDITERVRTQQLAEAMDRVSTALASTRNPAEVYQIIVEQAAHVLPCDHAAVLLYEGGWARVGAGCGAITAPVGTKLFRIPTADTQTAWLPPAQPGSIYVRDTVNEPAWVDFSPWIGEHRIRSLIAAPLIVDGSMVGMFSVHSNAPNRFSEDQLPVAAAFAERATFALCNARLYDAEHARAQRLAALVTVTAALSAVHSPAEVVDVVVGQGCAILGARSGLIRLLSDEEGWLDTLEGATYRPDRPHSYGRLPLTANLPPCDVVRTGRPVWLRSPEELQERYPESAHRYLENGLQAGAALPLVIGGGLIGVLSIAFVDPQRFDDADREFMQTVGELTAQALERAHLYAAEQERARAAEEMARLRKQQAEEAEALAEISVALSSVLEPTQLYQRLLDQFSRILPCDHAAVLLHEDGWVNVAGSWGTVTLPVGTRVFPVANVEAVLAQGAHGKPALIRDTADLSWIAVPPFTGEHTIRSVLVVPLIMGGKIVGTFNVDSFSPNFYTDHHLALAVTLGERVTQALRNVRLYEAERQRARAAEELARLRDDFVASVSHELRTPLAAIIGYAELLEARWTQMDDARRLAQMRKIVLAANRQQRLVEDLLLLSRLDRGVSAPRVAPVWLDELLHQAVDEVRGTYRGQSVELEIVCRRQVLVDAERAVQALTNILDNAAKYSPEGSPIRVNCAIEGHMAVVRVRDYGSGVPEQGRERLFTRFGRVPDSRTRAGHVGTGLGLHLSRQLVESMGGTLDLEASGPDGSTFRLCLPVAQD